MVGALNSIMDFLLDYLTLSEMWKELAKMLKLLLVSTKFELSYSFSNLLELTD